MSTVRTMKTMSAWRRAQHGWPASFPLVQFPNVPLFVAIGGAVASRLTDGTAHDYARAVFYVGLTAWRTRNWSTARTGTAESSAPRASST